ncbi:MAG: response regulator [Hyphomonas sp.]
MTFPAPITIILALSVLMNAVLAVALFVTYRSKQAASVTDDIPLVEDDEEPENPEPLVDVETEKICFEVQTISNSTPGVLQGLTVLVADDNEVNIDVLIGMLETFGLERIVIARNGEEAFEAAKENKVDIAYMDIQMPKMNGIEASKKILGKPENVGLPIIPITGFSRIVNADMCEEAGMTGFLQKPVELDALRLTTMLALRTKKMRTVA